MVRVHIDKKAFISSEFSCSNNFGSIRTWTIFEFIYASTCTVVKLYYFTWYVCIWWSKSSDMILISDLFDGKRITVEWESLWEDRTCDIFRSGMLVDFLVFDLIEIIHIHISYGIIIYYVDTNDRANSNWSYKLVRTNVNSHFSDRLLVITAFWIYLRRNFLFNCRRFRYTASAEAHKRYEKTNMLIRILFSV